MPISQKQLKQIIRLEFVVDYLIIVFLVMNDKMNRNNNPLFQIIVKLMALRKVPPFWEVNLITNILALLIQLGLLGIKLGALVFYMHKRQIVRNLRRVFMLELYFLNVFWMIFYSQISYLNYSIPGTLNDYFFYLSFFFFFLNESFTFIFWKYKPLHLFSNAFDGDACFFYVNRQLKMYLFLINLMELDE